MPPIETFCLTDERVLDGAVAICSERSSPWTALLREPFSQTSANEADRNQGQAANGEDQSTAGESPAPFAWCECPRDPHGCTQHEDSKFAAQVVDHAPRLG